MRNAKNASMRTWPLQRCGALKRRDLAGTKRERRGPGALVDGTAPARSHIWRFSSVPAQRRVLHWIGICSHEIKTLTERDIRSPWYLNAVEHSSHPKSGWTVCLEGRERNSVLFRATVLARAELGWWCVFCFDVASHQRLSCGYNHDSSYK